MPTTIKDKRKPETIIRELRRRLGDETSRANINHDMLGRESIGRRNAESALAEHKRRFDAVTAALVLATARFDRCAELMTKLEGMIASVDERALRIEQLAETGVRTGAVPKL